MMTLKKWTEGSKIKSEFNLQTPDLISLIYDGGIKAHNEAFEEITPDQLKNEIMPRAFGFRDEMIDSLLFMTKDVESLRRLAENTTDDPQTFIESLTFSAVNDIEIIISEPGKKSVPHGYSAMGFQSSITEEWKALLEIVRGPFPFFELGKSANRINYDRRHNRLKNLNSKLARYLRKYFSVSLPSGFKLHKLDKNMSPGTHRFIFKTSIVMDTDDKARTLDRLEHFSEMYRTTNDGIAEQKYFEKITQLSKKALENEWISSDEVTQLIRGKDDLRYDKLEKSTS